MGRKSEDLLVGIGVRLAITRNEIGLSQADMAKVIGVSLRAYHSYEKGDRGLPIEALVALHEKFKSDVNWILLGVKSARVEHDIEALQEFETSLDRYLADQGITIKSEKRGAIVARWYRSLTDGKEIQMEDVYTWIELLKE
ncbi:helix-turn-helix transcriptional regulator [Phaeobacter sp. HS012]|uniref:helix-turn-helix domain-containing protein n=1 Tax=Phaeobacter TaxID=302485 RepID=UPI001B374894|nr:MULTISPECIES: helix-turn-helix transcriptional regulator [Phaeobacter]MBQ4808899.1 helix-turn-helix transcriptional regulator [Phaeobacter sp. HS012]MBQ4883749.1 helix-turn-helix transcriptional regulator [Phaeobacter sp. HS011]UWS00423.1 helix-turn-helix domain-containing protein [Phaeobacter inhibens]UWS04305.1 helix-turn-helix domain-containing protein [Phaeobacter inhibens]